MTEKYTDINTDVETFFYNHVGFKNIKIISIKKIHEGLTNTSYKVKTNRGIFQLRFASNSQGINRVIEKQILQQEDELVYFDEQGNMIKYWIKAKHFKKMPFINSYDLIFNAIEEFHNNINIKSNNKIDYLTYLNNAEGLDEAQVNLFKQYEAKFRKTNGLVMSHNDLTKSNILIDDKRKIRLIDFEWACMNYEWFDYLYYLIHTSESNSKLIIEGFHKFKREIIEELFFISFFCLTWVNSINDDRSKFKKLKKLYLKRTNAFYQEIIN